MLSKVQIKCIALSLRVHFPYPSEAKVGCDKLARHLKEQGEIRYLKDLNSELQQQLRKKKHRELQQYRADPLEARRPGEAHLRKERILLRICNQQIQERELSSPTGWFDQGEHRITDHDSQRRMWVVNAVYMYEYSRRAGSWITGASFLVGREDGQYWAVRVPRHITRIREALDWIEPEAVKKARAEGRWIGRQGDVFLVEKQNGQDHLGNLPASHRFDPDRRELRHNQHTTVQVPNNPVRAYRALALQPGATAAD